MPISASGVVAKALVSVYAGHTEHKFWQFWKRAVVQAYNYGK